MVVRPFDSMDLGPGTVGVLEWFFSLQVSHSNTVSAHVDDRTVSTKYHDCR